MKSSARWGTVILSVALFALAISSKFSDRKNSFYGLEESVQAGDVSQQLWESSNSQNHNPYYNVFKYAVQPGRRWTAQEVRERVWQTLKDVEAMENHLEQQNAINNRMKKEIYDLDAGLTREKRIVKLIINEGMDDADQRLDLLQEALASNVSAVKKTLQDLSSEAQVKEQLQDQAIANLTERHTTLAAETKNELKEARQTLPPSLLSIFVSLSSLALPQPGCMRACCYRSHAPARLRQVSADVSSSRRAIVAARKRLATDRDTVRDQIVQKIQAAPRPSLAPAPARPCAGALCAIAAPYLGRFWAGLRMWGMAAACPRHPEKLAAAAPAAGGRSAALAAGPVLDPYRRPPSAAESSHCACMCVRRGWGWVSAWVCGRARRV